MNQFRTYGNAPYRVAVLHGGPGSAGDAAPLAREVSSYTSVIEPFQSALTIGGQLEELELILRENCSLPMTLAGYSWGAMLGFLFAARYPEFVKKLILISSAPFEAQYAAQIQETRQNRLSEQERAEYTRCTRLLDDPDVTGKERILSRMGDYAMKADAYDPIPRDGVVSECRSDIYTSVWKEAERCRKSGELLSYGHNIQCPVVAIHGDYDTHPADGVRIPLSRTIRDFEFILIEHCGHTPWYEKMAREEFFRVLRGEL
jgi:pimeloyl-ACP methyl ester carboxylesterase